MVADSQVDLVVVVGVQHGVELGPGNLYRITVALPQEVEVSEPV